MKGYYDPKYAESFEEHGIVRYLDHCRGYAIERSIPGSEHYDVMGCYPIFCCKKWEDLKFDIQNFDEEKYVSLFLVTDVFGNYSEESLKDTFNEIVKPFKTHYLIDTSLSMERIVSKHHRERARKALQMVEVERIDDPNEIFEEWIELYSHLLKRHDIQGIKAFSRRSHSKQFEVEGIHVFRAKIRGETVGVNIWYVNGNFGYTHMSAYNDMGYRMSASYALRWYAIEHFKVQGLTCLDIGGGAGLKDDDHGLIKFKEGWATEKRPVYFCGHVFNRKEYDRLCIKMTDKNSSYFPLYRKGEF
ncbi:MAG: GNAT family N-acetyltransferase [Candidatus Thermoplasmatota archaeon]|nr:GNAT family N-acetyltransferase [Candidatus Thermoplasmatota archaeon]